MEVSHYRIVNSSLQQIQLPFIGLRKNQPPLSKRVVSLGILSYETSAASHAFPSILDVLNLKDVAKMLMAGYGKQREEKYRHKPSCSTLIWT